MRGNLQSVYSGKGKEGGMYSRQGVTAKPYTGGPAGLMSNAASTNSPMRFQTQRNYSQTFSGPIKLNEDLYRSGQNQSMAQAAFSGDSRGYQSQVQRQGVQAGNRMQGYRAGLMGDAQATQAIASGNEQRFNAAAENAAADLAFQERQAGELGWIRDLLLDRDDVNYRRQQADYKREVDRQLGIRQRKVEDEIAQRKRESMLLSSLI